jgi:hypothetical protein
MFDPITLSLIAGGASLVAGIAKSIKTWLARKAETSMIMTVGDKEIRISGAGKLGSDELKAIVEAFQAKVSPPSEDAQH